LRRNKLKMNKVCIDLGRHFKWGVSTAAYQVEGGWNADGKGKSIWDVFSHKKGKTFMGHNGDHACDYYHRYTRDIAMMRHLGIPNYRFSLSWSRIIPNGTGAENGPGIDFYNQVTAGSQGKTRRSKCDGLFCLEPYG
jgi:beta-glucosidase